ncbi:Voltage-gated Ion Channel (VIC) Superfamily [Achlya hypogyna]|uniref:Voltage-gated Ion Channel (VIC) Superfamily n=1 Tax=Achlya hypogyna TaxID=1202772 RepID=A0A1V9ZE57_ACHHY|nr:Voltage-gated Ion Channel (VIC) Superfamily [Achlya hypogyna]
MAKAANEKVRPQHVSQTQVVNIEAESKLPTLMRMVSQPKAKRISFNIWKQSEVIPATNRVSLRVTAEERKKLVQGATAPPPRFMVYPDSAVRLAWDTLIAVTTVFLAWRLPYSLVFEEETGSSVLGKSIDIFTDIVFICDVLCNFRTGYRRDIEIVLDPKQVAINYASTWFFVDLAGSIPYELIFDMGKGVERVAVKTSLKYLKIPKLFRLARVIRFVRKHLEFMYTFQLLLVFVSIVHWNACGWASTTSLEEDQAIYGNITSFTRYGMYLYASTGIVLNMSPVMTISPEHYIFAAILSFVGFGMMALVLASVTAIYIRHTSRASEYQNKIQTVMSDLKALQVPKELRTAAKNYYDMLWRVKKTSDRYERSIYEDEDLSPLIRAEIALHIHRRTIALVPLFKGCTDDCLASVVMRLKTQLYNAKDVVFHRGEPGRSMLIILRGKVKIIGPDNSVVAVLKEGSFFGEIGLLANTSRSATAVAATFCEMKSLDQRDAEVIFSLYPNILDRLYRESDKRKRENKTRSSFSNIKVLDNAHVVDKCTIDEVHHETSVRSRSRGFDRTNSREKMDRPSLLKVAGSKSLQNVYDSIEEEKPRGKPPASPPPISAGSGHAVVKETLSSLTSLHLDVERLKDTLQTIMDNQTQIMTKLNTMDVKGGLKRKDLVVTPKSAKIADRTFRQRRQSRDKEELLSMHEDIAALELPVTRVNMPPPLSRNGSLKDSTRSGHETSDEGKVSEYKSSDTS